jgi:hypothetical protein
MTSNITVNNKALTNPQKTKEKNQHTSADNTKKKKEKDNTIHTN